MRQASSAGICGATWCGLRYRGGGQAGEDSEHEDIQHYLTAYRRNRDTQARHIARFMRELTFMLAPSACSPISSVTPAMLSVVSPTPFPSIHLFHCSVLRSHFCCRIHDCKHFLYANAVDQVSRVVGAMYDGSGRLYAQGGLFPPMNGLGGGGSTAVEPMSLYPSCV